MPTIVIIVLLIIASAAFVGSASDLFEDKPIVRNSLFGTWILIFSVLIILGVRQDNREDRIRDQAMATTFSGWHEVNYAELSEWRPGEVPPDIKFSPDPKALLKAFPGSFFATRWTKGTAGVMAPSYIVGMAPGQSAKYGVNRNIAHMIRALPDGQTSVIVRPMDMVSSKGSVPGQEFTGTLAAKLLLAGKSYPFGTQVHGVVHAMDGAVANGGSGAWISVRLDEIDGVPVRGIPLTIGQDPEGLASAVAQAKISAREGETGRKIGSAVTGAAIGGAVASRGHGARGAAIGSLLFLALDDLEQSSREASASEEARKRVPAALVPGFAYTFQISTPGE